MVNDTVRRKTIGLDLGDRESRYVVVDAEGEVCGEGKVKTERKAMEGWAQQQQPSLVVLETGGQSAWVSRVLGEAGHEVVVADARAVGALRRGRRKNDRNDAEFLARMGRADRALLRPVQHREEENQVSLATIHARAFLVSQRTALVNHVRQTVKLFGYRLPACSAASFGKKAKEALAEELRPALEPLVDQVEELSARIRAYDREVEKLVERHPAAGLVRQTQGVGTLTAVTFVLTLGDARRFAKSRQVGAYLGLVPRQQESGERRPQLGVSKAGDRYLRVLLVQCAQHTLGPYGKASALREWGLKLAGEGNPARKKRAVTAVARKLAVLLHRLWLRGEAYEPWPGKEQPMAA